jgi:hypothetical protein
VGTAGPKRDLFVAFVVRKRTLVVYLCDGKKISEWFGGTLSGGRFDLLTKKRTRITGRVTRKGVRGSLKLARQRKVSYGARRATGLSGLYIGRDTRVRGKYTYRWIVFADSLRGSSEDGGGQLTQEAAISEPGLTTSTGESAPAEEPAPEPQLTCDEIRAERDRLATQRNNLQAKSKKTKWDEARIALLQSQIDDLAEELFGRCGG